MPSLSLATKGFLCAGDNCACTLATMGYEFILDLESQVPQQEYTPRATPYIRNIRSANAGLLVRYMHNSGHSIPKPALYPIGSPTEWLELSNTGQAIHPKSPLNVGVPTVESPDNNTGKIVLWVYKSKRKVFKVIL